VSAPTSVLIVDDSAVVRQVPSAIVVSDPHLRRSGTATDAIMALEKVALEWPDLIVLDIDMARMDGITLLKKLMRERPTRVLICSSLTEQGAEITMQALAAGAVGYVTKPKPGVKQVLSSSSARLLQSLRQAAPTTPRQLPPLAVATPAPIRSPRTSKVASCSARRWRPSSLARPTACCHSGGSAPKWRVSSNGSEACATDATRIPPIF
jgi:two-component system chemotaxis response regulator CheB